MFLFNTISHRKEEFSPLKDSVRIYACGMTVQDRPHLGHMRAYITVDVLRRYLESLGYKVTLIQNFTDIDDKVLIRAREEGRDYRILTQRYIDEYLDVADELNIKRASFYPRATQHIQEIIELIQRLLQKGLAYESGGDVYYDVTKFPGYGKLSGKRIEDLIAGARVEPTEHKRNPLDFVLWKGKKEGEPYWLSPFGEGRPGWHIECSAMAMHYLGETLDIHAGGEDLIFPHHENEIAQSEGATGKTFVRFWFHNAFLNLKGEKMAKSTKHYYAVRDLLEKYSPNALRLFLLQTHYRTQIEFDFEAVERAERSFKRIEDFLLRAEPNLAKDWQIKSDSPFREAMEDDLNTPKALALIFDLVSQGFKALEENRDLSDYYYQVKRYLEILGFEFTHLKRERRKKEEELLQLVIKTRQSLREKGEYSLADDVRKGLLDIGYKIEDTKEGTRVIEKPD